MEYNLDEVDANLSAGTHGMDGPTSNTRSGGVVRTNTRRGSVVTMPGTRRGSLKGRDDTFSRAGLATQRYTQYNLFHFELRELAKQLLLQRGETRASYHEYAVYSPPDHDKDGDYRTPSLMASGADGLHMLQYALRHGYGLDDQGKFVAKPPGKPRLQGRVRQFIVDRLARPNADGLHMKTEDFEALDLHAATLPSIQRVTTECSFWNPRKDTLYIVFSFSANPQPPYDFLSMSYNLRTRTTTALIRRSFDTRWHDEEALNEYEQRLTACQELWGHPLVLPIVLLQVQLLRTEEAVLANNEEVLELEGRVDDLTGKPRQAPPKFRRRPSSRSDSFPGPLKRLSTFKDFVGEKVSRRGTTPTTPTTPTLPPQPQAPLSEDYMPPQTIHLMKEAHDVLKGAIQLLDTLRWMERAVKLLIQAGDELDIRSRDLKRVGAGSGKEDEAPGGDEDGLDDMGLLWHEIKQYLESIWRLCTALETDRRMSELRCRAQIDIIYSKMAQEDNNLNARMAVASTRDSSSMKALAVITAIFLPGEYMSSLFGQAFFNWEYGTRGDPALSEDAAPDTYPNPVIMPLFWVYWAFTIPLTIVIIVSWRAWWVNQDRFFRRHLSPELSNERYWTTDGKPRELDTSFMQDMLSVFRRSGRGSATNRTVLGTGAVSSGNHSSGRPSPVSRRSTFESDNIKSPGPGSPGGKDISVTDTEDWEGTRKRTRTISFAMRTGPHEPPSAV